MKASENARQVVDCRVCGKADWQQVVSFGPLPLANTYLEPSTSDEEVPRYPLGVMSCRSCRVMSLTHVVDPEILYRSYPYTTSDSQTMLRHMRHVVELCCERFAIPPGSLIVEVGSNTGSQLVAFRDAGMRTLGVDPARNIAEVAEQRGVKTLPEFFSPAIAKSIRDEYGPVRLVLGRHVFAHMDDIAAVASAVRELLDTDGVFAIEVPYAVDMLARNEFDTIYHEHLSYFTVGSLATLFKQHGLRVVDVERLSVHGGSILVFAGLDYGRWTERQVVQTMLELEENTGIYNDDTYHRFAESVEEIKTELPALIRSLVGNGKRIAGYGAPAKGNTLLNICGLGPGDLEFCCDTTDFKQGKVLPGTYIPVRSPEYAKVHKPDYYLLLAWNYAEEIIGKEQAFIKGGGRFIVPNPKPSIVDSSASL